MDTGWQNLGGICDEPGTGTEDVHDFQCVANDKPQVGDMIGQPVSMSASAARRIAQIVEGDAKAKVLRLSVLGGGCSGFSYEFALEGGPAADDLIVNRDGAQVVIDAVSLPYLEGSEIDFIDDLIGQSFKVINPNATASCGCGTSFSV